MCPDLYATCRKMMSRSGPIGSQIRLPTSDFVCLLQCVIMNKRSKLTGSGNRRRREWHRRWLLRRDRRKFLKPRIAIMKPISAATRWGCINRHTRRSVTAAPNQAVEITLPSRLDFEENYETTVSHFRLVRNASYGRFRIRKLRFDDLVFISPAAALVLASEVDRWKQRVGGRLRANVETWNDDIKRLLCQMGYFELLELDRPPDMEKPGNVIFLNFLRGESGASDSGKLAQKLRVDIEAIIGQGIRKLSLFEGLSEAITNVSQHAYPVNSLIGGKKQWWLSASFDKRSKKLDVMFYDQGIGIPNTLPKSHLFEGIKVYFNLWTDSQKLTAAMEYGRSVTGRPERGKGLTNLLEFAKAHREGVLSIYSQRGLYRFVHSSDNKTNTLSRDSQSPIGGTLIEWSVTL